MSNLPKFKQFSLDDPKKLNYRDTNQKFTSSTAGDELLDSSLKIGYEEILTTDEAAKYLKVSVGSLRNMTSNGQIPYYKLGGRNRYVREDLRKLLLAYRRGGFNGF